MVSTPEAAARLGVTTATLKRYVKRGHLRPSVILPSGAFRWSDDDLRPLLTDAGVR